MGKLAKVGDEKAAGWDAGKPAFGRYGAVSPKRRIGREYAFAGGRRLRCGE